MTEPDKMKIVLRVGICRFLRWSKQRSVDRPGFWDFPHVIGGNNHSSSAAPVLAPVAERRLECHYVRTVLS